MKGELLAGIEVVDRARFELATFQMSAVHYTYIRLPEECKSQHNLAQLSRLSGGITS